MKKSRHLLNWVWRQQGTPTQRALGLGLGVFSGCFPLFGFQIVLGIFLARICKANQLLAAVGTWISNPITYIPLYWFNYQIGDYFLGQTKVIAEGDLFSFEKIISQGWIFSYRLFFGSMLVGIFLGFFTGLLTYLLIRTLFRN